MRMSSGPSKRNEKPRSGLVDLHRGDAEIERDAVDRADAARRQQFVHRAEAAFDQGKAAVGAAREFGAAGDRRRIAVDAR